MTGKVPKTELLDEDAALAEWEVPREISEKRPGSIAAVFMHCTPKGQD